MARKVKLAEKKRIKALEEYMKGEGSCISISKKYGMHRETLLSYVRQAQTEGIDVLRKLRQNLTRQKQPKSL